MTAGNSVYRAEQILISAYYYIPATRPRAFELSDAAAAPDPIQLRRRPRLGQQRSGPSKRRTSSSSCSPHLPPYGGAVASLWPSMGTTTAALWHPIKHIQEDIVCQAHQSCILDSVLDGCGHGTIQHKMAQAEHSVC